MNERIEELYKQSFIEVQDENSFPCMTFSKEKFVELIVKDCYVALFPALRDMISRGQAYEMIRKHFGTDKENEIANILAGEQVVEDFGGYEESTREKYEEFAAKRNYTYSDIVSDGGMDPRK